MFSNIKLTIFSLSLSLLITNTLSAHCSSVKHWGLICASETESAICGTLDGTNYIELVREACPSGQFCNEEYKNCTTTPNMKSSYAENFNCPERGYYPNLGNCQNFIYCDDNLSPISLECPSGKMFSTVTGCCTETLTTSRCNQREISCKTSGDVGAIAGDNRYFYFCLTRPLLYSRIYPQVMKCPNNQVFSVNRCIESATTIITPVTTRVTNAPTTGTTSTTENPKCTPGAFERIIDDCRSYMYCDSKSVWYRYSCGSYAYFDINRKKCIVGKC